mmetsp:Transcript_47119/g.123642  ORF Transcript_47119/g.123642 Transcript_47119/m.123642 type:complete len:968 (+) Transcript_47119:121-3024(+)|eukprot:CAMPEP_0115872884 /NCGR_PEP_ID=MMETSP0287-20121206/23676_1 /TAXON_ID=412157 /ORGANISM="Chrysochromulina rotalis, Strain UIO044" /LENGTH=967 /DNA_ID=CAMNT_0003327859 /DNA_START=40 /DNA_END=2943 /DNA_ORIENTATION=-
MESTQQQQQTRLLEMDPATLLEDGPKEAWEAISDLDNFFSRVYAYYQQRGLLSILATRISSLLTLAFTIILFIFLWEILDWDAILHECTSEDTCADIRIIRSDPFGGASTFRILYYYLLFTLYWVWSFVHFLLELRPLLEMHAIFRDRLRIDDSDLHVITWDELVVKVIELQRTMRLCIVKDEMTAQDIANRIMRKENFLIALVNQGLLPLQPFSTSWLPTSAMAKPFEWSLYVSFLDAMFDKQFRIRQSFTQDVAALQLRLVTCGVVLLLLAPFFVVFMLVFIFLKHAEEFRHRPTSSALSRDYSLDARWTMREFNELPHVFEARLQASHADAAAYIRKFPAPLTTLLARFVTFIVSAIAAVLLLLSLCNDKFLFYRFPPDAPDVGFNVLWWLAMLSTVLAISRSFDLEGQGESLGVVGVQPDALLQSLALHTHHMPEHWRGRGHTRSVYAEFTALYQYRIALLFHEVVGAVTAPLVMIFLMPQRAAALLAFVRSYTVYVEGVGHVCSFALFDFERHGDTRYGSPLEGSPAQQSRDGKMEKSYINFRAQHPSWRDARGDALIVNIAGPADEGRGAPGGGAPGGDAPGGGAPGGGASGGGGAGGGCCGTGGEVAYAASQGGTSDGAAVAHPSGQLPSAADRTSAAPGGAYAHAAAVEGVALPQVPPAANPPAAESVLMPLGGGMPTTAESTISALPASATHGLGGGAVSGGGLCAPPQRSVSFGHVYPGCASGTPSCGLGGVSAFGSAALGLPIDASFSASAMAMLTGSSHHLLASHTCGVPADSYVHGMAVHASSGAGALSAAQTLGSAGVDSGGVGLSASVTPHSLAALAATNSALASGVVSAEARTQQLAAGLYSRLDLYYARTSTSGGLHRSAPRLASDDRHAVCSATSSEPHMAPRSPLAVGTSDGDYQLHDDTHGAALPPGQYEMQALVGSAGGDGGSSASRSCAAGAACAAAVLEAAGAV